MSVLYLEPGVITHQDLWCEGCKQLTAIQLEVCAVNAEGFTVIGHVTWCDVCEHLCSCPLTQG